jgi:Putative zinc-finger
MRCPQALDTGAYVLGALASAERDAYERHLATCPECRQEVARLAVLPGLLARLEGSVAETIARDGHAAEALPRAPETLLPQTLRALETRRNAQRRRRRWQAVGGVLLAGCLAVGVGVAVEVAETDRRASPTPTASSQPGPQLAAMRPLIPGVPVGATVGLTPLGGGTRVYMHCWYRAAKPSTEKWELRLVVVAKQGGAVEEVTRWTASDGDDVVMQEFARMPKDTIGRVEVRFNTTPALVYEPS